MDHTTGMNQRHRRRTFAIGVAALVTAATVGSAVVDAHGGHDRRQRADVVQQGGAVVYESNGARLVRTDHSVEVTWKVHTPEPGSYAYPTPDMVPPGAPIHPEIVPGYPEVFTLWLFNFDHPELCSDEVCDGDDLGDTAARGSVYQVDGEIAYDDILRLSGKVRLGQAAANGLGLSNPLGSEVHIAMAPHGQALDGAALVHQLNSAVGGPPLWFAAAFPAP